jgi:hypothetical protein
MTFELPPQNPHYFIFRGKPTVLVTSAEHYGAVLNGAFDYTRYLDELSAHRLNHTRTFSGVYHELPGAFGLSGNTLAPRAADYLSPWARSRVPGAQDGLNKFDLNTWNEPYFSRLLDFMDQASQRGIVVEFNLFCPFYSFVEDGGLWRICPLNIRNNINGVGDAPINETHTLRHPDLLERQLAFVRRVVPALNGFDNLYYEVCNEPWVDNVEMAWQERIAAEIWQTESALPNRHLVSLNISNVFGWVENPHPAISILNFHYASPPETVRMNYHLDKPIGNNETGFTLDNADATYRRQAWEFMLAGGALFNNLDNSFAVGHEDGSYAYPVSEACGCSRALRAQYGVLKEFMESLDFISMKPDLSFIRSFESSNMAVHALAALGKEYAFYAHGNAWCRPILRLPAATWRIEWLRPEDGVVLQASTLEHAGGDVLLPSPRFEVEIAFRARRI